MSCSRKDRMTGKQLYEANHLYLMIAFTTGKCTRKPPPKTFISKDDLSF